MAAVVLEERSTDGHTPRREMKPLGRVAAPVLAALSGAAAAIHFTVVPEHLAESRRIGTFFFVIACAQAAWALAVVLRPPTRRLLLTGAVLNGAVACIRPSASRSTWRVTTATVQRRSMSRASCSKVCSSRP